jgi:predicted RNA-binding Zn-ribbon protein involved in translation (DUF1610 family)
MDRATEGWKRAIEDWLMEDVLLMLSGPQKPRLHGTYEVECACGAGVVLNGQKSSAEGTCPKCGRTLIIAHQARARRVSPGDIRELIVVKHVSGEEVNFAAWANAANRLSKGPEWAAQWINKGWANPPRWTEE